MTKDELDEEVTRIVVNEFARLIKKGATATDLMMVADGVTAAAVTLFIDNHVKTGTKVRRAHVQEVLKPHNSHVIDRVIGAYRKREQTNDNKGS